MAQREAAAAMLFMANQPVVVGAEANNDIFDEVDSDAEYDSDGVEEEEVIFD